MASRIFIALIISVLIIIVGYAASFQHFHKAYASTADDGDASCAIPENSDKIKEIYQKKSNALLANWLLDSIEISCEGSISASYILPEFSDNDTTFRTYLQQNQPLQQIRTENETPFPAEFIEQRDLSVAQSVSGIMSNYVFKEVDKEFTNKTISFFYGTNSHFYISAYKDSDTCKSNFEVDGLHPELLFLTVSNEVDIDAISLIKTARDHAKEQLENASTYSGAMKIRNVSDTSCGQTAVHTTSYMTDNGGIEPYAYSVTVDIQCNKADTITTGIDMCPKEVQILYGTSFQLPIASSIINDTDNIGVQNKDAIQAVPTPTQLVRCQELEVPIEECNDTTILQRSGRENIKTGAWFYSTIVPIGVGSAIVGTLAFVFMFRRRGLGNLSKSAK